MDDSLAQIADGLATLTSDAIDRLEARVDCLECAVDALRFIAKRPYLSTEQALLIRAEADELLEKDIEPLRAALRDPPMSKILKATVEELDEI